MKERIKTVYTGRFWGNKVPEKVVKFTKDGKKFKKTENDSWAGPGSYDEDHEGYHPKGQYERITWLEEL